MCYSCWHWPSGNAQLGGTDNLEVRENYQADSIHTGPL